MSERAQRWLIGCERSARVRDAMRALGVDAWSCDIEPCDGDPRWHIQDDVLRHLDEGWDGAVFFPPCTRLTVAGARWFKGREAEQAEAIAFCEALWSAPIARVALENPIGILSTRSKLGKPTQIIQPWQFGHGETKATCLWLKGLPKLIPTNVVEGREARVHRMPPGPERSRLRGLTYLGIADAIATQWT